MIYLLAAILAAALVIAPFGMAIVAGTAVLYLTGWIHLNLYAIFPCHGNIIFKETDLARNAKVMQSLIKPDDPVYFLGDGRGWYLINGYFPAYRHFLPYLFMQLNPEYKKEFALLLIQTPPKWLLIPDDEKYLANLDQDSLRVIQTDYQSVYTDPIGTLYRRQGSP